MQPTYLPWIGYFYLIDNADVFVFLDDVKLEKSSWHVRNRVKTSHGELYLTVPVINYTGRLNMILNKTPINNKINWKKKHLKTIQISYHKSKYFDEVYPIVEELINSEKEILSEFNEFIIQQLSLKIGIKTKIFKSSELTDIGGKRDNRLVSICLSLNCNKYISPVGSSVYLEKTKPGGAFSNSGVELYYMNYEYPTYNQLYGEFIQNLSFIDLIFNEGFENSIEIIRSGHRKPIYYEHFKG